MKFAYVAVALFSLAYASPIALEAPLEDGIASLDTREETSLSFLDAREVEGLTIEEREKNAELMTAFDDMFAAIEERAADFDEFEEDGEIDDVIEARSVGSVLKALKTISSDISKINGQLSKFGNNDAPSTKQALAIRRAGIKLDDAVKAATSTTKASKSVGKKGSKKIFGYVKGKLAPATKNSLQNFINHAPGFKKGGYTSIVRGQLKGLKSHTNSLGNALVSRTKVGKYKKKGKKLNKSIQKKFSQTLKAY